MYHFLVNPSSCSGRGGRYWKLVKKTLEEKGISYQVHFSEKAGDMERLAAELTQSRAAQFSAWQFSAAQFSAAQFSAAQFSAGQRGSAQGGPDGGGEPVHLIVLGGDGTVNEAIQGIRDFKRTRFSFIPTGSSNDLARDMGISRDPVKALLQILEHGRERPMDVGVLHYHTAWERQGQSLRRVSRPDRLFLVSCGIGFDAGVCQKAMSSRLKDLLNRVGLGKLTYLGIALNMLLTSGKAGAVLETEGESGKGSAPVSIGRLMFAAVMNHQYEGGGFRFCPGADAFDGRLDVCAVGDVPKWKVLLVLPTAFWGGHFRFRGVERHGGSRIRIRTRQPLWVHTDGEVTALSDDITVNCRRGLLRFYA